MRISSSALKCQQQSFSWQGCRLHPAGDWLQVTWDDNARKPQSARACAVDPEAEPPCVKRALTDLRHFPVRHQHHPAAAWIGYLLNPVFVAAFALLAIGWALMLVSSIVGCVLYGHASR
jgi:hypothetical protein